MNTDTRRRALATPPRPIFDRIDMIQQLPLDESRLLAAVGHPGAPDGAALDVRLARSFLVECAGGPEAALGRRENATTRAYRRDLERLYLWAWYVRGAAVHTLARDDIQDFLGFVQKPPVAWIGIKPAHRFVGRAERRHNPDWRPFRISNRTDAHRTESTREALRRREDYAPAGASMDALRACLRSFFGAIAREGLRDDNPAQVAYRRGGQRLEATIRQPQAFTVGEVEELLATAEEVADQAPSLENERILFVLACYYHLGLRVSELSCELGYRPSMAHFIVAGADADAPFFAVYGKGGKERTIPVSPDMQAALARYRRFRGLAPDYPVDATQEARHWLVPALRGREPITTSAQLRSIIQRVYRLTAARLESRRLALSPGDPAARSLEASVRRLQSATPHWLRHSIITHDLAAGRDPLHVQTDAGHASFETTRRYLHLEDSERQASLAARKRLRRS
ncbi:MAG TPA: hypothetical protein DD491_03440 [Halieaceae bacterium]|nr:hypothetical protein [Halieaceae bacterium]